MYNIYIPRDINSWARVTNDSHKRWFHSNHRIGPQPCPYTHLITFATVSVYLFLECWRLILHVLTDLTGSADGSVRLYEWGHIQPLAMLRQPGAFPKVTKVLFSSQGNKVSIYKCTFIFSSEIFFLCSFQVDKYLRIGF